MNKHLASNRIKALLSKTSETISAAAAKYWRAFSELPAVAKAADCIAKGWAHICTLAAGAWRKFKSLPVVMRVTLAINHLTAKLSGKFMKLPLAARLAALAKAAISRRRLVLRFLIVNLIILALTSPLVVIYGPFDNVKRTVVGAIVTSRHPHYITWLLSAAEIKAIVGDSVDPGQLQQQQLFQFKKREDDFLRLVNITSSRFQGFLLEVPDPTRVKAATARDIRDKGDTVSTIAFANNAVAAINAGGFDDPMGTGTGRLPYGVIIHEGQFLVGGDIVGPVQVVGITKNGVLVAGTHTIKEMKAMQLAEGVTFGPPLIINGKKLISEGDGGWGIAPRTAIGQRRDGTILLLVIDGRQPGYSLGATLMDVQNILYEQGAYNAANLDGGSSTTMFYNGKVINRPADMLGERMIPTAFIVR